MLEDQLIRDLNNNITNLTGDVGALKSTLKQYEQTIKDIKREITILNKNINKNTITIAKATGFVGTIALIISTVTTTVLHHLKLI